MEFQMASTKKMAMLKVWTRNSSKALGGINTNASLKRGINYSSYKARHIQEINTWVNKETNQPL